MLDFGITEPEFWSMTIAELERALESRRRVKKLEAQERASFDYALADLIGRSVGRLYASSNTLPDISAVYPTLFDSEEIQKRKQAQQAEISALRFKQFAQTFNKRFKEVAIENE